MARRRRSRRAPSRGGMIGGLRKNIKKVGAAAVGLTGLFIAASPAITAVQGATVGGTNLSTGALNNVPIAVAQAYGVNTSTGQVDLGRLLTTVAFPVVGGFIFIKGLRMILRAV